MRIYLIGFMGSGKSTVGKIVAHRLSIPFYDMDDLIENSAGTSIASIFQQYGESYFRKLEQEALYDTEKIDKSIIATGGGTPCFFDNMEWIKQHGASIYLKGSPEILCSRLLKNTAERPLIKDYSEDTLLSYIHGKLEERAPFYEQADVIYHQTDKTPTLIAEDLIIHFDQIFGH
jgi:shikimate kinase